MYVSEVTIRPHIPSDRASNQQMSNTDNSTTINIENVINITRDGSSEAEKTENAAPPPTSPNPSVRSATSISIASIESDAESSVIESDIDEFEDTKTGCMLKKLGQHESTTINPEGNNLISNITPKIAVLLGQKIEKDVSSENGPQIASLSLTNSTDVTFGHKKCHRGPVTIKQILTEKPTQDGHTNPAFEGSNGCSSTNGRAREREHDALQNTSPPSQISKYIVNHKAAIITTIILIAVLLIGIMIISTLKIIQGSILQDVCDTNCETTPKLISRADWLARTPNVTLDDLLTPTSRVIITHTTTEGCSTMSMCIFRTRFIQNYDMLRSMGDIQYNFLVGGDGNMYVGRGWDKVGAHTEGFNNESVGIAFIGTFNKWPPPETQLNATKWLISEGVRLNKLIPDFKLYGSRQLERSDGPGDALYEIITKWPNWSNEL